MDGKQGQCSGGSEQNAAELVTTKPWSLWKTFLVCLLACLIATALVVLVLYFVHFGKNTLGTTVVIHADGKSSHVICDLGSTATPAPTPGSTSSPAPITSATSPVLITSATSPTPITSTTASPAPTPGSTPSPAPSILPESQSTPPPTTVSASTMQTTETTTDHVVEIEDGP